MSRSLAAITAFSWGYYGWGSAADKFVQLIDRVEASRGFKPPLFADIRISRKVRAAGFRERGFEKLVGTDRYHWIRGLGNQSIIDRQGPQIKIADPKAVEDLLELAIRAAQDRRRVIYFCGCAHQRAGRTIACHRWTVGSLLLKAASKRGLRLETVEWPGGEPLQVARNVSAAVVASYVMPERNALNVPVGTPTNLVELGALPWASIVALTNCGDTHRIFSGPVRFIRNEWQLPYIQYAGKGTRSTRIDLKQAADYRKWLGVESRSNLDILVKDAVMTADSQAPGETVAITALREVGADIKRDKQGRVTKIDLADPREVLHRTRESRVTDEALPWLAAFPDLQHLCLFFARITDDGLKQLIALKHLKHLWLNQTPITDAGMEVLTKLPALESLWLLDTFVTNKAIKVLQKAPKLNCLRLGGTAVTDSGVKLLVTMKGLKDVSLAETKISENAIELLGQMKQLRKLGLEGTEISHGGVQHLRKLLPKAKILGP